MVRGVFETSAKAGGAAGGGASSSSVVSAYAIEPGAPPGMNPLWNVLLKKVDVLTNSFVCVCVCGFACLLG